ncbi:MAG: hypothetical protein R3B47_13780 [Bacteroidia bacterium]
MQKERLRSFTNGAKENGVSEEIAKEVFDLMEKFAWPYGFFSTRAMPRPTPSWPSKPAI